MKRKMAESYFKLNKTGVRASDRGVHTHGELQGLRGIPCYCPVGLLTC